MKISEALRKTGIFRVGATGGTYTNATNRPIELQMEGVYNAEKDLIGGEKLAKEKEKEKESKPTPETSQPQPVLAGSKPPRPKWQKIAMYAGGTFLALFVLAMIFGTPSAKMVFSESLDTMLQTKYVTVRQEFSGNSAQIGALKMDATSYIDLTGSELSAKGEFSLDLKSQGVPLTVAGKYIAIGDHRYVNLEKLASSEQTYASAFSQIQGKLQGKWLISRDGDNFTTIASTPADALTEITALPFAYVSDDKRKDIVSVLQDEESFTIVESSKVTTNGVDAYRYELEFDKDNQKKVAGMLNEASSYLKPGDSDNNGKVTKLEVWINIQTKQIIKMEYSGTTDEGTIDAVVTFSDYNKKQSVEKPSEYFIESELVN